MRQIWMVSTITVRFDLTFQIYYEKKTSQDILFMTIIGNLHINRNIRFVVFFKKLAYLFSSTVYVFSG